MFPYSLCEGNHLIYLCPYMDEASKVLEILTTSQPHLLIGYRKLSPNHLLVDEVIDQNPNSFNPNLCKHESHKFVPKKPLVEKMVESIPPLVNRTFPVESESHTTQVLLVSSSSNELGGNHPILMARGGILPFPTHRGEILLFPQHMGEVLPFPQHEGGNYPIPTTPAPCIMVISFDWIQLVEYHLPSYVPFQIIVRDYNVPVPRRVIDEGTYVSILSSTTWKVFIFPQALPITQNLLAFNKGTIQQLGILPQLPINVGANNFYKNVMVVQSPLDFNLVLGCHYVYNMGALVSSLFRVMCFPHEGRIMTIDQLSFISTNLTPNQPNFLNGPYMQVVSSPPQINYVATYSCSHHLMIQSVMQSIIYQGHQSLIFPLNPLKPFKEYSSI